MEFRSGVQRWWRTLKGRQATQRPQTIQNCHAKLMTTAFVNNKRRRGRPSTSLSPAKVAKVPEMFDQSPQKSTRQAARESGLRGAESQAWARGQLKYWAPLYI